MTETYLPHRGSSSPDDDMSPVPEVFPHQQADFERDPRVSFDRSINNWVLKDTSGKEYEWMPIFKEWIGLVRLHHPSVRTPFAICFSVCA